MYVIVEGTRAVVIDPFADISPGNGLTVDHILLTHEHYDHISGVNLWKRETAAPVLCSGACAANIQDPRKNLARYFKEFRGLQTWVKLDTVPNFDPDYSCRADASFEDSMTFPWKGHTWRLFELPGHSMGSIGILLDERWFFSGDSLLEHHEIALRLPGGSRKKWKEIGEPRLAALQKGVRVYPGHFEDFLYRENEKGSLRSFDKT